MGGAGVRAPDFKALFKSRYDEILEVYMKATTPNTTDKKTMTVEALTQAVGTQGPYESRACYATGGNNNPENYSPATRILMSAVCALNLEIHHMMRAWSILMEHTFKPRRKSKLMHVADGNQIRRLKEFLLFHAQRRFPRHGLQRLESELRKFTSLPNFQTMTFQEYLEKQPQNHTPISDVDAKRRGIARRTPCKPFRHSVVHMLWRLRTMSPAEGLL